MIKFETVSYANPADVKMPRRSTPGSAGYDFYSPVEIVIEPGEKVKIFTGVKVRMNEDVVLMLYPRSSHGIAGVQLLNTVGIIDSDYYNNSTNEGQIVVQLINKGSETIVIPKGGKCCQGIFTNYFLTDDDEPLGKRRTGGFGSTGE